MSTLATVLDVLLTVLDAIPLDREGYAAIGDRPTSRPRIPARDRLARYLHAYASGRCVVCGCRTTIDTGYDKFAADRAVIMHIVPCGSNRKGFIPGNVANGCHACNVADGGIDLRPFVSQFAHWQGIPTEWPPLNTSVSADSESFAERALARQALGLPY